MNYFVKKDLPYLNLTKGEELVYDESCDGYTFSIKEEHVGEYGTTTSSHEVFVTEEYLKKFPEHFESEFVESEVSPSLYINDAYNSNMKSEKDIEDRIEYLTTLMGNLEAELDCPMPDEDKVIDLIDLIENIRTKVNLLNWVLNEDKE